MEKIVANGDRDCTIVLDGTECSVKFDRCFLAYSVQNNSISDVFVSIHQGANAGDDGVVRIKAGSSGVYAHMRTEVKTVYFNGTGEIQVHGQNDTNNSFRNAPAADGGGTTVDSYSKTESDARYAQKSEIPKALPANGGNADTVGGVGIANLRQITQTVLNTLPAVPNGEGDYLVNCDTSDTSFPYWYGYLSIRYGSYTGEYVATFRTTGNDNKVYYNTYLTNHWSGWQEISATPIKSTQISGTTNDTGNVQLWAADDKRIPIAAVITDRYAYIFRSSLGIYCVGIFHPDNHTFPESEAVSGTVYYIEKNTINVG